MAGKKKKESTSSIISNDRRAEYHVSDTKTAGGRKSVDSNDGLAKELRGLDAEGLRKFARKEGGNDLVERFDGWVKRLNPGQCRMNLGNVVRALRRNAGKPAKAAKTKAAKPAKKAAAKKPAAKKKAAKKAAPAAEPVAEQAAAT